MPEDVIDNARFTARDFLFEIECVVCWRRSTRSGKTRGGENRRKYEVLIKWKGYDDDDNTWLDFEQAYIDAPSAIDEMFEPNWATDIKFCDLRSDPSSQLVAEYERLRARHE